MEPTYHFIITDLSFHFTLTYHGEIFHWILESSDYAPRMLGVEEREEEKLTAPLSFFVEVSTYTIMSGAPPPESAFEYKKFQGKVLTGVAGKQGWQDLQTKLITSEDNPSFNLYDVIRWYTTVQKEAHKSWII